MSVDDQRVSEYDMEIDKLNSFCKDIIEHTKTTLDDLETLEQEKIEHVKPLLIENGMDER